MTDNEIMYCFENGCSLLNNDDIDREDINGIRRELEKCAQNMLPYIHRYITKRVCSKCKHNKKLSYVDCKYENECITTIERDKFVKK